MHHQEIVEVTVILKKETNKQINQLEMKQIILMKKIKPGFHGPSKLVKITEQIDRKNTIVRTVRGTWIPVMEKLRIKSPTPPPRPEQRSPPSGQIFRWPVL